ncbi:transposase [Flavobacterium sp. DSR3-2]|uniref:transposase n=1 Tax=Flavobacterium sp. DSR3-2 TaxID=2804634 RepID=UPI003CF50DAF
MKIITQSQQKKCSGSKMINFLSNSFDLSAQQIALLYKQRWPIILFFKCIKQHLKIKTF